MNAWRLTAEEWALIKFIVVDCRYAVADRRAATLAVGAAIEEALATHRPASLEEPSRG